MSREEFRQPLEYSRTDSRLLSHHSMAPPTSSHWTSVVVDFQIELERVLIDRSSADLIYYLKCDLKTPIPPNEKYRASHLAFGWPLGGIWQIKKWTRNNTRVSCFTRKMTELSASEVKTLERQINNGERVIFQWMMQLAEYKDSTQWFLRKMPPPPPHSSLSIVGKTGSSDNKSMLSSNVPVTVEVFGGLAPAYAHLTVHNIIDVNTAMQQFSADVTWVVTFRGITTSQKETLLRELLYTLHIREDGFDFTNIVSKIEEQPIDPAIIPTNDDVELPDPYAPTTSPSIVKRVYDLQYTRRVAATFIEEMFLYHFPFDTQVLTFPFQMRRGGSDLLPICPEVPSAGVFDVMNFSMGNEFDISTGDQVFVGDVVNNCAHSYVRFEVMLRRRSGYYMMNFAIPATIITYLCFTSYAPTRGETGDNEFMDMGDRIQIVMTLVLTAVTFKYNVADYLPKVAYFTTLDKYLSFCFLFACVLALESAFYPFVSTSVPGNTSPTEMALLIFFLVVFTFANVAWAVFMYVWVKLQCHRGDILLGVHNLIGQIQQWSSAIPVQDRVNFIEKYLKACGYHEWELPEIKCTSSGYVHVRLIPDHPVVRNYAKSLSLKRGVSTKRGVTKRQKRLQSVPLDSFYDRFYNETTQQEGAYTP